jgi:hypothetical protein
MNRVQRGVGVVRQERERERERGVRRSGLLRHGGRCYPSNFRPSFEERGVDSRPGYRF